MLNIKELKKEGWKIYKEIGATYPEDPFVYLIKNPKVVIIGQDPYPKGANGYAFMHDKVKGSLKNIYTCVNNSFGVGEIDMYQWVDQGVMLMNTYPTLGKNKAWLPFTKKILNLLRRCVIIAWGKEAANLTLGLDKSNHILLFSHPSPAFQCTLKSNFFVNNTNFIDCNKFLKGTFNIKSKSKNLECLLSPKINWLKTSKPEFICYAFTDASYRRKLNIASWCVYFPEFVDGKPNLLKGTRRNRCDGETNIGAEGLAIYKALDIFRFVEKNFWGNFEFKIFTDCKWWITCIEENQSSIHDDLKYKIYKAKKINLLHVKAHEGFTEYEKHNEVCDKLAKELTY